MPGRRWRTTRSRHAIVARTLPPHRFRRRAKSPEPNTRLGCRRGRGAATIQRDPCGRPSGVVSWPDIAVAGKSTASWCTRNTAGSRRPTLRPTLQSAGAGSICTERAQLIPRHRLICAPVSHLYDASRRARAARTSSSSPPLSSVTQGMCHLKSARSTLDRSPVGAARHEPLRPTAGVGHCTANGKPLHTVQRDRRVVFTAEIMSAALERSYLLCNRWSPHHALLRFAAKRASLPRDGPVPFLLSLPSPGIHATHRAVRAYRPALLAVIALPICPRRRSGRYVPFAAELPERPMPRASGAATAGPPLIAASSGSPSTLQTPRTA